MPDTIPFSMSLDENTDKWLRRKAESEGVSMAEIVRRLIKWERTREILKNANSPPAEMHYVVGKGWRIGRAKR